MELPKPPQTNIVDKLENVVNTIRKRMEDQAQIDKEKEKLRERIKDHTPR